MKRVLMLITDLERGGTPLRVVRWARWLPRIGVTPIVGCLAPRGPLSAVLDELDIENLACGARHRFDLGAFRRLAAHVRRVNPDLIHSFLFHANIAARAIGRLDRARPIVTSTATIEIERRWHRVLESLTRDRSTLHVVNSPTVAKHVIDDLRFAPERVAIVPNGIDLEQIDATPAIDRAASHLPADVPMIVWAGRMDPIKGLDTWVEVFDRVRRDRPVAGVLLGDGPIRDAVLHDLAQRGLLATEDTDVLTGKVRCPGWSDRPAAWLKAADVLLFPSRTEGNPNIVLEAMAAGCPVVASAVGGCRDLIQHRQTGRLCAPDDVGGFESAVKETLISPGTASMIELARKAVSQRESKAAVLSALEQTYARLWD